MIKTLTILICISLFGCSDEEPKLNSVFINIKNSDSTDKYIFLDSWLTILEDSTNENNEFLYSSNFLINKIAILDKENKFTFNNSLIHRYDVKGALGVEKIKLALLKPNDKLFIEFKSKFVPPQNELKSKSIKYQIVYFRNNVLDSLDNYIVFKSDTITIERNSEFVYTKPLNKSEIGTIYKLERNVIEIEHK